MVEYARVEAGDRGDVLTGERNHEEAHSAGDVAARVAGVNGEGGLAIGSRVDDPAAALSRCHHREEAGGVVAADVLERERRHADPHVFGEQRDDCVDVIRLEGARQLRDEFALGL